MTAPRSVPDPTPADGTLIILGLLGAACMTAGIALGFGLEHWWANR